MEKKYISTCFIDRRNDLVGRLYLSADRSVYIDFGQKDIFVNEVRQSIPSRAFRVLELLIKNYNIIVVSSDIAYEIWGYESKKTEEQMITNEIAYLKNHKVVGEYIRYFIGRKRSDGYSFNLGDNLAIRRISLPKESVADMTEIFAKIPSENKIECVFDRFKESAEEKKEEEKQDLVTEKKSAPEQSGNNMSLEMSSKFFHTRANELMDSDISTIDDEIDNLSRAFNAISILKDANDVLSFDNIVSDIYDKIVDSCHNKKIKNILKIKGPLGSYKTRILEFIYLKLEKEKGDILPFYINVSYYEKMAENNDLITEDELINAFMDDFGIIEKMVNENPDRIPLLIIDGIRDFKIGKEFFYSNISQCIKKLNLKLVVSLDSDFTMNPQRRYSIHPLAPNTFTYFLRINSMQLYNKKQSVEFIKNCVEVFDIPIGQDDDESFDDRIDSIYDQFINMNLLSIDAFWLYNLLKAMSENVYNQDYTIFDLYHSICFEFLGDEELLESTMDLAFDYEYGSIDLKKTNCFFDDRWRLIRRHRSVLEYFIASKYIKMLSNLDFKEENREKTIEDLDFFNMVLPKTITRFIVSKINEIDDYEHNVLRIAEKYYNELTLFGKSELTFWMGRLRNTKRKRRSVELLREYRKIEQTAYENSPFESLREKRDRAFILRGVLVSLIYEKDKDALCYYLNSLISDKIANSVNRGFHLEYYGDKPYNPRKSLLDFEDDLSKGKNTLNIISLSLDQRMEDNEQNDYVALVELMTLCNLIQARVEVYGTQENVFWVGDYVSKCLNYLSWVQGFSLLKEMPRVKAYFLWMTDELKNKDPHKFNRADMYNLYTNSSKVLRTGWVNNGVPEPENIMEHMYKCWLVGLLHLPDECDEDGYDKQEILQLLLIHDLGETVTGDINRPEKLKDPARYDKAESKVMHSLMFYGTYPTAPNLDHYLKLWEKWDSRNDINYKIAKDIDDIQTMYQYCEYNLAYPDLFTIGDTVYWLAGKNRLNTEIGKKIFKALISNNPLFAELISEYDSFIQQ